MTIATLAKYLIGDRAAILQIAGSRQALGLGLIFVLAAGFAREYDGEDLLAEPWHLVIPLGASLASSAVLYLLVRVVAWFRGAQEPALVGGYFDFLGLYWLTAPLALVYAIPVERFLSAGDATRANLWMLGLVALWRVLLMARVLSVLYRTNFMAALSIVGFFADSLAVMVLSQAAVPILATMGGIRLSESQMVLASTSLVLMMLATYFWPIWLISALVTCVAQPPYWEYQSEHRDHRVASHLWAIAAVALGVWIVILPITQPEQRLRTRVERDLLTGRIAEGLATMSAHEQDDFPPHWDPPPRFAYRASRTPDIHQVQRELDGMSTQPWVRNVFAQKYADWLFGVDGHFAAWYGLSDLERGDHLALVERMPERQILIRERQEDLDWLRKHEGLPRELKQRIEALLRQTDIESADKPDMVPATALEGQRRGP